MTVPGCYQAIEDAVTYCGKSVDTRAPNYFELYYACIHDYKEVAAVATCSSCYCQTIGCPTYCSCTAEETEIKKLEKEFLAKYTSEVCPPYATMIGCYEAIEAAVPAC